MKVEKVSICLRPPIAKPLLLLVGLATVLGQVTTGHADGLIIKLPPDGTSAKFEGYQVATVAMRFPKELEDHLTIEAKEKYKSLESPQKSRITCRVSCVGSQVRAQQKCRWIELSDGSETGESRILKMLIPEKFLSRGEDPLDHTILTLWPPDERDGRGQEKGFDLIQYELDRRRRFFPRQLEKPQRLANREITTPAGTYTDCEVLVGTTEFDEPLNCPNGRWVFTTSWELTLHPDAPFGLVDIRGKSFGRKYTDEHSFAEVTSEIVLTLANIEKSATSQLSE